MKTASELRVTQANGLARFGPDDELMLASINARLANLAKGRPSKRKSVDASTLLLQKAIALYSRDDVQAMKTLARLIHDFGRSKDPQIVSSVALAMYLQGEIYARTPGGEQDAIRTYDGVFQKFGGSQNLSTQEYVAAALGSKLWLLNHLGQRDAAAKLRRQIIRLYSKKQYTQLPEYSTIQILLRGVQASATESSSDSAERNATSRHTDGGVLEGVLGTAAVVAGGFLIADWVAHRFHNLSQTAVFEARPGKIYTHPRHPTFRLEAASSPDGDGIVLVAQPGPQKGKVVIRSSQLVKEQWRKFGDEEGIAMPFEASADGPKVFLRWR